MNSKNRGQKQNRIINRISFFIVVGCLLLLGVVVVYKSHALSQQRASLAIQKEELTTQLDDAEREYKALEEKEEYMKTDEYKESVARAQLGLVYPDEIVVKPEE
jgi:cell division protein DivIC